MGGPTKQSQTQEKSERNLSTASSSSAFAANGGDNPLLYIPHGSLERLARILVDIARNPPSDEEPDNTKHGEPGLQ